MGAGTKGKVTTAPSEVVVLTPANFDKIVLDPSKDVLVEFFAPWYDTCLNVLCCIRKYFLFMQHYGCYFYDHDEDR